MGGPLLTEGACVAIVAPSGIFDPVRLSASVALAETWGLRFVEAPNLRRQFRYTNGTAAERTADFRWALTAPEVDAVWFARGGFGTVHVLEGVPWAQLDDRPVIGFSDATAFFAAQWARRGGRSVHGPVLHSLADHTDEESRDALRAMLVGAGPQDLPGRRVAGPAKAVSGPMVGGNLCVLASLAGTPDALDARGCILVLEEVGERAYRVDRLVTQLHRSGGLDGVIGVALGDFLAPKHPADAELDMLEVLIDLLAPLGVPVVADLPVGHGHRNLAFEHGALATLTPEGLRVG
jgi:muramoyltetrapeptide carboxypeptidase